MLDGYTAETYGEAWADVYDDPIIGWQVFDSEIDKIRELAGSGPVLDLGCGTGRIAFPLAQSGIEIDALDSSHSMLEKFKSKLDPSMSNVSLIHDQIQSFDPVREYPLVLCLGQSFMNLLSFEDQLECLKLMKKCVTENGGRIVVDLLTPDIRRFRIGQDFLTSKITPNRCLFSASKHDDSLQLIKTTVIDISEDGVRLRPNYLRYVWPQEFILMASISGLEIESRWSSWRGVPYRGGPGAYSVILKSKQSRG